MISGDRMKQISIIVPAYNCEQTIIECVNSVKSQTYDRWELIIVNDGSTDSTAEKLNIFGSDSRIKVIASSNKGVSCARNIGIKNSTGDYIMFLDSDDCLTPNACLELVNNIGDSEISIGSYITKHTMRNTVEIHSVTPFCGDIRDFLAMYEMYSNERLLQGPWGKLFLKEIIDCNHIHFPEHLSFGEDTYFVYEYLSFVNRISYSDVIIYEYYVRGNSLCHGFRDDKYEILLQLNSKFVNLLLEKNINADADYVYKINRESFASYLNDCAFAKNKTDVINALKKAVYSSETHSAFECDCLSLKYKLLRYMIKKNRVYSLFFISRVYNSCLEIDTGLKRLMFRIKGRKVYGKTYYIN